MRVVGKSLAALVVAFVVVTWVEGQQGQPGRGGGGGGGFGQQDAVSLVRNAQVRKELEITDEQLEKIPGAMLKALTSILNDKQMARLRQIELQQRGTQAFSDPLVQKELKISSEQESNIKTILEDSRKELAEIFKEAKGGNFGGM